MILTTETPKHGIEVNPKHEVLNPKQYLNSNSSNSKLWFGTLGFEIWNLFRISDLGFRIFNKVGVSVFPWLEKFRK